MQERQQTMSNKQIETLEAVEQKVVYFLDDELVAARAKDGHIYVSLRHLCQALGLDRYGQVQRIQRQTILDQGHYYIEIETAGGQQTANMLRVDLVPLWLSGVSTRSLKQDEVRAKLERYQAEAAKVLWEAFQDGRLDAAVSWK
jgi:anti-repressor protein